MNRRMLVLLALLAGLLPAAPARTQPAPCSVVDGPAWVCAEASLVRIAHFEMPADGGRVSIAGFMAQRLRGGQAGTATSETTGGCLEVHTRRYFAIECPKALKGVIDPTLGSATIKGSWKSPIFGAVTVDLTAETAAAPPEPGPPAYHDAAASCSSSGATGESSVLRRHGPGRGSVRFGSKLGTVKPGAESATVEQAVVAANRVVLPQTCAPEPEGIGFTHFTCTGAGVYDPIYLAGGCAGGYTEHTLAVNAAIPRYKLSVLGSVRADPGWVESPDALYQRSVCLVTRGSGFGFAMCVIGRNGVEIDPLLRSGSIKATFDFGGMLRGTGLSRVIVDLKATGGAPQPGSGPHASEFSHCGFALGQAGAGYLHAPAAVTGTISFGKLGTARGTTTKPLAGRFDAGVVAIGEADAAMPC